MTRKIRTAVIGLGMGARHAEAYRTNPDAELVAVCDKDSAWLDQVRKEHEVPQAYDDYRQMLQEADVDAVSVCLPNHLHASVSIECLRAGKHVLCEKPMALNGDEAQAMADAAEAAGRILMVSQNQRFSNEAQYLKRCMEEERFGKVYYVKTAWRRGMGSFPSPSEPRGSGTIDRNWLNEQHKGGGVLRDLGSHLLDRALWLLDFPEVDQIVGANCCVFTPALARRFGRTADAEDFAAGMIRFTNGSALELEVSFGGFIERSQSYLEINGTLGGALLIKRELKITSRRDGEYVTTTEEAPPGSGQGVHGNFIYAIQHDVEPLVTAEQGVEVIRILDAIYAGGISANFSSPVLGETNS